MESEKKVKPLSLQEFCAFSGIPEDYWMFRNKMQKNTFWEDTEGIVYFDNGDGVVRKFEKAHGTLWFSWYLPDPDEYGMHWSPWRVW